MYGKHIKSQISLIQKTINGKGVIDLGCGTDTPWIPHLAKTANFVIGVDKDLSTTQSHHSNVYLCKQYFHQYNYPVPEIVFMSWPVNYESSGLIDILQRAEILIYVGCNMSPTACGTPDMFAYFLLRQLLVYDEQRLGPCVSSNLIILGRETGEIRCPVKEEALAMLQLVY